ncbi:MAG: long-chain fatty acid transporter, partial [Aeromonas sobria]
GTTYHFNPDMSLDFGLTYIDGKKVDVDESLGATHGPASPTNPHWVGTSHGDAFLASVGFNMKF